MPDPTFQNLGFELAGAAPGLAAGWALSRPEVSTVLIGAKRPAQVEQNVRASDVAARPEVVHLLDRIAGAYRG